MHVVCVGLLFSLFESCWFFRFSDFRISESQSCSGRCFSSFHSTTKAPGCSSAMRVFDKLDQIADEAAAGSDVRRYLDLRGIKAVATLALIAADETELERTLIAPLLAGWKLTNGDCIKLQTDEHPIAKAIITHMWMLARQSWQGAMAVPIPKAPSVAPLAAATSAAASSTEKVPKTLPPGVWMQLVRAYNMVQLHGRDREFPVAEVLGAESVLARMYFERNTSKTYTPIGLGELVQKRSFTAAGDVNPLAKSSKKTAPFSLDEEHQLVQAEDPERSPKSQLAIIDGINSIRWALILVQWGEEYHVHNYANWMVQRARSRPSKVEQFITYWTSASWSLTMALRNGQTFAEASGAVMADLDKFTDHMAKEPVTPRVKINPGDDAKGKGKYNRNKGFKGNGKSPIRFQPYNKSDRWQSDQGPSWQQSSNWNRSNYASRSSYSQDAWQWDKQPQK